MVKGSDLQNKIDELDLRISEIIEVLPRCIDGVKSVNEAQLKEALAERAKLLELMELEA